MGGSSSKSDSSSGSSMEYDQNVFGSQADALQGLYDQASSLFGQNTQGMQALQGGAEQNMQDIYGQANVGVQDQMAGGVYQDMGLQNSLMSSLNQSLNNPSMMSEVNAMIMGGEGNNYADAMRDQYTQDAGRAQQNMLGNLDARAAASGMSGGSRHGTATAQGMDDINRNLQSNMANVGYQTFDQDLDRKLQIAGMADQNTLASQQMMSDMLGQQQGTINQGVQGGQDLQSLNMGQYAPGTMPWDAMAGYQSAIGAPTVLSSGSGTMSGDSSSKGMSGGIGGGK